MNETAEAVLESLGQREKLEGLGARFGLPHVPEKELSYFGNLFAPELRAALAEASSPAGQSADALAWRGRVRRLTGDLAGAVQEFGRALDIEPRNARALEWLGEAGLGTKDAQDCLTRALECGAGQALLYRGAASLLEGDRRGAARDLEAYVGEQRDSALGHLLAGVAATGGNRALKHFETAAKLDPSCSAAHLLRAKAERGQKRMIAAMEDALDADPDYAHMVLADYDLGEPWPVFLRRLLGFAFAKDRSLPVCVRFERDELQYAPYHFDALAKARSLARAHPGRAWPLALVGRALSRLPSEAGGQEESLRCFDEAIGLAPRSGWLYAWRALAWTKGGDSARALSDFASCFELQPFYYRAYAWRASVLRRLGRTQEALFDLERAVPVDGLYPFLLHERSLARRAAGDWAGAALDLDRAFRLDHRYSWTHAAGREPLEEELERGQKELDAAVAALPSCPSLKVWRGGLKLQRGDAAGAFQDFARAARQDPRHALAQAWMGFGLISAGRYDEAAASLRRAVELEPTLWIAHGRLAEAVFRGGDRPSALQMLDKVLRLKPKAAWALRLKAELLLQAGRSRPALSMIKRAIACEGRNADGYFLLARALEELNDLPGARDAVDKVLTISPDQGRAYLLRARLSERRGDFEAVVEDYRIVLRRFPYLFNEEQRARVAAMLNP